MDLIIGQAVSNWSSFLNNHLFAKAGQSPLSLEVPDVANWDWSQVWSPSTFEWKVGVTPMADLGVIRVTWMVYFTTIISLKLFMHDREPFKLRKVTAIHNLFLCIGSLGMWIAGVVGSYQIYQARGIEQVYWSPKKEDRKGLQMWSMYIFFLSKFPELIDTVILVLKKKPVIFLHWYHHAIVIPMVWGWCEAGIGLGVLGLLLNTGVHVFMYWYYFASNLGWNVWFKKYITSLQIAQFITSFMITWQFIVYAMKAGNFRSWSVITVSNLINFSFLCLFVKFYIDNYKTSSTNKAGKSGKKEGKTVEFASDLKDSSNPILSVAPAASS